MTRGTSAFDVSDAGDLLASAANVEKLRRLWLDRSLIRGSDIGPGAAGDFDNGAWHVSCHLVGAGGVRRAADGRFLWLEISHDASRDEYYASVTGNAASGAATVPIDSAEGQGMLRGSMLLGFVEGNSVGHISARGVRDSESRFNGWRRQEFDRDSRSTSDGGKVWEHWCTLRDIREPDRIAGSVLKAYIALCAALGDRFAPTVARGRRDYGHPKQLCALVRAGFCSKDSATWRTTPTVVPDAAERSLLEAQPARSLAAVALLPWDVPPRYYMFERRIARWSSADAVARDLQEFGA